MYTDHFGLTAAPFSLTPDTGFFLPLRAPLEALNMVLVALHGGEGFLKVTGEVGTGKTLICRKLLDAVRPRFVTAYVPNPLLEPRGLFAAVAEELGVRVPPDTNLHHLNKCLTARLIEVHRQGRKVVLVVDEAQAMPGETLEALRLLTNLETQKRKLLQVVLFAQPELDATLADHQQRQLAQRITFAYRLRPMDRGETRAYIHHRLRVAGYQGPPLFSPWAVAAIHRRAGGIPRLVNVFAHKGLLLAYGRGRPRVGRALIGAALADVSGTGIGDRWWRKAPALTTLATVASLGVGAGYWLGG